MSKGYSKSDIIQLLGLSEYTVNIISKVFQEDKKLGQHLNFLDLIRLYQDGLTNLEISELKGVTRQAVSDSISKNYLGDLNDLKEINKENRNRIKNVIIYDITVGETIRTNKETAFRMSGYTKSVFNIRYNDSIKWKTIQEILENEGKVEF